jgi:hypothetical protein
MSFFRGFSRATIVRRGARVGAVAMLVGCLGVAGSGRLAAPGQMPPNTVLLSTMMQDLSSVPGFTDGMIDQLQKQSKVGAAVLTPDLVERLRVLVLGQDWNGLDRFPGWTMREINPTVRVVGHVAGKDADATTLAKNPGSTAVGAEKAQVAAVPMTTFVDLGPYRLDREEVEDLDKPSTRPAFSTDGLVNALGDGVVRGDGPDPRLAEMHPENARLSEVLNRLSLNGFEDSTTPGQVTPTMTAKLLGHNVTTPQDLVAALIATGHEVVVADARYFANFGHLHYNGEDVMMPFWVNTKIVIPGSRRPLLVPVSHAEYEWQVRGPKINASISFYFGIDGKAEFRVMDQLDQPWVMNRHAHEYRGADAVEVTRLAGEMVGTYARLHRSYPKLPFGGYYALGVCQDVVAAIEWKMTGKATLFPNTADASFFVNPKDEEINRLIRAIPKDRDGKPPGPERIFGSLPTEDLAGVSIPGLGPNLVAVHQAWTDGTLERTGDRKRTVLIAGLGGLGALLLCGMLVRAWRRSRVTEEDLYQ